VLAITTADPLVSVGTAHFWLKEKTASAPTDLVAEVISLTVMTGALSPWPTVHRTSQRPWPRRTIRPRSPIIPGNHPDRVIDRSSC